MSTYQPTSGITIEMGPDMTSAETRTARGVKIESQAKQSPIYTNAEVQPAVDTVIAETVELKTAVDTHNAAQASLRKARTALVAKTSAWDGSFRMLVAAAQKNCATADDVAGLGLAVLGKTKYPLAPPVSVEVTHDAKKGVLRIRVSRAPGMRAVSVELSTDPFNQGSWTELPGNGVIHEVKNPTPGTWWVRAASRTAKAKSDFTSPRSVIVT